jgi:hypothetical protein
MLRTASNMIGNRDRNPRLRTLTDADIERRTIPIVMAPREDGYEIATDPDRLDIDVIHRWLSTDTVWGRDRSRETVERCVRASVNFGVYDRHATRSPTRVSSP